MITRGIKYYNIADIKKQIYRTIDAKKLENAILDGEINISKEPLLSPLILEKTTKHLNLFLGDLLVQFIPKEAIHLFFQYREFSRIANDSLMSNEEIRDKVTQLEEQLMDYDAEVEEKSLLINSYVIIYQLQGDGKKQLDTVGTTLPAKILGFFSDERIYTPEDGLPILSDDGIPEGLYYYRNDDNEIVYTNSVDRGRQVGT